MYNEEPILIPFKYVAKALIMIGIIALMLCFCSGCVSLRYHNAQMTRAVNVAQRSADLTDLAIDTAEKCLDSCSQDLTRRAVKLSECL